MPPSQSIITPPNAFGYTGKVVSYKSRDIHGCARAQLRCNSLVTGQVVGFLEGARMSIYLLDNVFDIHGLAVHVHFLAVLCEALATSPVRLSGVLSN